MSSSGKGYSSSITIKPMSSTVLIFGWVAKSTKTLPLHRTTLFTLSGPDFDSENLRIGRNLPEVNSFIELAANGCRRRLFGVMTTNGLDLSGSLSDAACVRRRWKYCAAVVGFAIRMFPLDARSKKRSRCAWEWFGP